MWLDKRSHHVLIRSPRDNEVLTAIMGNVIQVRLLSVQLIQPSEVGGGPPVLSLTRDEAFCYTETAA